MSHYGIIPTEEQARETRAAILDGISHLPKLGSPGPCDIQPDSPAIAVLTANNVYDTLITASTLGKGRILLIGHDSYLKGFIGRDEGGGEDMDDNIRRLHANMKTWLSRGAYVDDADILNLGNVQEKTVTHKMSTAKIAFSTTKNTPPPYGIKSQVEQFVREGGGLVCAYCPWGFLNLNPECSLDDLPFHGIAVAAGTGFTADIIRGDSAGFEVSKSKAELYNQVLPQPPRMEKSDRECILYNMTTLSANGASPGGLVVYSDKAEPILTGEGPEKVFIASGKIGKGRVLILSHKNFLKGFGDLTSPNDKERNGNESLRQLQENMKGWASRYTYNGRPGEACDISRLQPDTFDAATRKAKILFWCRGGKSFNNK